MSSGGSVKHLGRNRFAVSFQLEDVQKPEQDLYRCVTQSSRGSGVSNFAELIVKGEELVFFLSFVLCVFILLPIKRTSQDNGILAKSMSLDFFFYYSISFSHLRLFCSEIISFVKHLLLQNFYKLLQNFYKTCTFMCSWFLVKLKGVVHTKIVILSLFMQPHVVSNLYAAFLSCLIQKK